MHTSCCLCTASTPVVLLGRSWSGNHSFTSDQIPAVLFFCSVTHWSVGLNSPARSSTCFPSARPGPGTSLFDLHFSHLPLSSLPSSCPPSGITEDEASHTSSSLFYGLSSICFTLLWRPFLSLQTNFSFSKIKHHPYDNRLIGKLLCLSLSFLFPLTFFSLKLSSPHFSTSFKSP